MEEERMIMAALSTLTAPQLSKLTHAVLSQTLHRHHRLAAVLSSPLHFSLTLHHLHSLSLCQKTLLIAKTLLSSLHQLTRHFHPPPLSPQPSAAIRNRELDAAVLLLLLCDVHRDDPEVLKTPRTEWREVLSKHCYDVMLMQSPNVGVHYGGVLLPYIEMVTRCWRFVGVMGGCGRKEGREVATAPAVVVGLSTVEVHGGGGGVKCVICREEMGEGRDVCELPCQHLFHWICILPWLEKRNTCPCCRLQLPTDDVFGEIERLWSFLVKISGGDGAM